jgi:hypothetical protein
LSNPHWQITPAALCGDRQEAARFTASFANPDIRQQHRVFSVAIDSSAWLTFVRYAEDIELQIIKHGFEYQAYSIGLV